MRDGFIKVAAITPKCRVADVEYNTGEIIKCMALAEEQKVKIAVFPELSLTGYSCGDLFFQQALLSEAREALLAVVSASKAADGLFFVGLPFQYHSKLYNVAAAISHGRLLALIPKSYVPSYGEFYEMRQFTPGMNATVLVELLPGEFTPLGRQIIFPCEDIPELIVGAEICEDLWAPNPPSNNLVYSGATVIANLSASNEIVGKSEYRRALVTGQSARLYAGYIYANAGIGESTQDVVYAGHSMIAENGILLAESSLFEEQSMTVSEIDVQRIIAERRRMTTYHQIDREGFTQIPFFLEDTKTVLTRPVAATPFVPQSREKMEQRCGEILNIQSYGLRKRLVHTGAKKAVVGISGGLDSTLALLVTARAFASIEGYDPAGIIAVTMPGFGTTDRTYHNAVELAKSLGCTVKEVSIADAVRGHFADIGQDENNHDVTYENSQARERTQILMDIANMENGLVIGTGDMSELALGWATYNGDHMSMYGVNASVPKTLVRHLVGWVADNSDAKLKEILYDIKATPVSPELLPAQDGEISQKTEDLVGPYELHDFFLYYVIRFGFAPSKIFRLALYAFEGKYEPGVILKWEKTFYRRFFAQQFKRSCIPDGPKVGSVSLSPRGDWRMPSDAHSTLWLSELEDMETVNE